MSEEPARAEGEGEEAQQLAADERTLEAMGYAQELLRRMNMAPGGTAALVRSIGRNDPRVRCLQRVGRRGLSSACIEGLLAGSAPVLAVMDADLQHDETILPGMLQAIERGAEVVEDCEQGDVVAPVDALVEGEGVA